MGEELGEQGRRGKKGNEKLRDGERVGEGGMQREGEGGGKKIERGREKERERKKGDLRQKEDKEIQSCFSWWFFLGVLFFW